MAKSVVTHPNSYWRTIAVLAGGDAREIMWDGATNELEVPGVTQFALDTVMTNFDHCTPMPLSWPTGSSVSLSAVSAVSTLYWKNVSGSIAEMTQAEKDAINTSTDNETKLRYDSVIDQCSEMRIRRDGFEWPPSSGKKFSLSQNAQIKWLGLEISRSSLTYPYAVPTQDNSEIYQIASAIEAENMYFTAVGTIDATLSGGTAKKGEIQNASSKAAAHALASNYLVSFGCSDMLPDLGE